ncbi:MAG: carbohydrate binding family 9 domain-containing protein, partial [Myxococcota bacterium]
MTQHISIHGVFRRGRGVGLYAVTASLLFLVTVPVLVMAEVSSEERPTIEIGWTENPPKIDGHFSPEEWADAAYVGGLTQARPDAGEAPTQRTEVWIMTDRDHLYIAARLWDENPEEIVRYSMARDQDLRNDDRFGFTIDPFLDRQNGYFFQVNANGARRDFLFEGGGFEPSWDGRWYAKASVDERGWTVEIALPYAAINFDPNANVWGFNMARGIRRRNEIDRWADPVRERFLPTMGRAGNLVGMKGIRQGTGLRIVPSGTLRRVDDANQADGDDRKRHFTRIDPSLDVFYKATPSVT